MTDNPIDGDADGREPWEEEPAAWELEALAKYDDESPFDLAGYRSPLIDAVERARETVIAAVREEGEKTRQHIDRIKREILLAVQKIIDKTEGKKDAA